MINPIPGFSEPFASLSHLLAAGLAFCGVGFLIRKGRGSAGRISAIIIYTIGLVFLFSMSGVYHLLDPNGLARFVFRRLDHAGIWVLIAATFTPIHIILFRSGWRWAILLLVWPIAITGLVLEVVFFDSFPEWLSLSLYLGLGWIGALSGMQFHKRYQDKSLNLLILGGLFYSIGAVIDFIKTPVLWPGVLNAHELFHVFVIFGAIAHWRFIYHWANYPLREVIQFHVHIFPDNKFIAKAQSESIRIESDSLEMLKLSVANEVRKRYHKDHTPQIHLRYFNEEFI
ncbi:MAG: hypothetical protein A4S09_03480 [Proteobacteria bacterium SG_bin7]|nr:MAG: hypothetical protein A4S09_03480 [Proteobacteria bacterium SG_bin7]